jgi:hypothetical protein
MLMKMLWPEPPQHRGMQRCDAHGSNHRGPFEGSPDQVWLAWSRGGLMAW